MRVNLNDFFSKIDHSIRHSREKKNHKSKGLTSIIKRFLEKIKHSERPLKKDKFLLTNKKLPKLSHYVKSLVSKEDFQEVEKDLSEIERQVETEELMRAFEQNFHYDPPKSIRAVADKFLQRIFKNFLTKIQSEFFKGSKENLFINNYPKAKEKLDKKKNDLESGQDNKIKNKIADLDNKYLRYQSNKKKASQTRERLKEIGGESVKIDIRKDKTSLDGMYLSAYSFREKLKNANAKLYSFEGKTGIVFEKEKDSKEILQALENVKAFPQGNDSGAGWIQVKDREGRIVLLQEEDSKGTVDENNQLISEGSISELPEKQEHDFNSTVILTSGNRGVYEQHYKEIVAFLLQGLNVMTFNFPSYGESKGTPNVRNIDNSYEAVYSYLQKRHPVPDEKILVKGLCLSGGPATRFAAKHPQVNLFLDQTYSDLSKIAQNETIKNIKFQVKKLKENEKLSQAQKFQVWAYENLEGIAGFCAGLIAPKWKVKEDLKHVNGKIGILMASADEFISPEVGVMENFRSATEEGGKDISVFSIPGEHSQSWVNIETWGYSFKLPEKEKIKETSQKLQQESPNLQFTITCFKSEGEFDNTFKILGRILPKEDSNDAKIFSISNFKNFKKEIDLFILQNNLTKSEFERQAKKMIEA